MCTRRLQAADFGVFIDVASLHQKEAKYESAVEATRTIAEETLYRDALSSLDVLYSHAGTATMLCTALPHAIGAHHHTPYGGRGWCAFENLAGMLIRPDSITQRTASNAAVLRNARPGRCGRFVRAL